MNKVEMLNYHKAWNDGDMESLVDKFERLWGISDVVDHLKISGRHMTDRRKFINSIATSMCFLCGNNFLIDPSLDAAIQAIREDMEMGMSNGTDPFMNLVASTIAGWAACEYFDLGMPLEAIKNQSIAAAWTDAYQRLMEEQWRYMQPVMQKYQGSLD